MGSIAADLGKPIWEKLMNATIEQSRYFFCFTCITKDFEREKERLKAKAITVGERVEEANRRDEKIQRDVTFWQEKAKELIQEDTKTKRTCFFGWCPNCKWQYSRGKELSNKTNEITNLIMESNFERVGIPRGVVDIDYHSSRNYISFKSRELKLIELRDALTYGNNYMIGLHGMGGAGKTTLAREVGKELKNSNIFDKVIDTTISNTPDIKKIQDEIAGPLGKDLLKDCSESERPKRLWSRLTNGERILIILDDVWGDISFEDIGIPFKDNCKGCRILVTTRDFTICNKMECDKIIQLELLHEEEAWILFKKHAGLSDSSPQSILVKGRKIAKECKGLPVAIAVIASNLKGQQHEAEWNRALNYMQKYIPLRDVDESLVEIYKCLKYSYDNMKNEIARRLFLLCSLFPEDAELGIDILTRFSIGVGLVGEIVDSYDVSRNEVAAAINKLIDSCLLLNVEFESVKMHDLAREVALWISNKEIQAVNTSNKNQKLLDESAKSIKYLLCEGKSSDVSSLRFDKSKLEILIVRLDEGENDFVDVNSFLENMIRLRVLYLSHETIYSTPTIPLSLTQSIQSLTNVRSLFLRSFVFGDISILGNLQNLETLDLLNCSMDELPHEISKLEKLRLLNLGCCCFERNNSFEVIQNCPSLEELQFIHEFTNDSSMHENVKLPDKLQRFHMIDLDKEDFLSGEWLAGNCLVVSNADVFFFEATFNHLMQIAEYVYLDGLQGGWTNLIPKIISPEDHEGTLNLVQLKLDKISQFQCLIDTKDINSSRVQNVFSKLVVLRLLKMKNLKEICDGPLPIELFKSLKELWIDSCENLQGMLIKSKLYLCNLKSLTIMSCPMLTSLFQLSTAQSLVLLEDLTVYYCEQVKSIIDEDGDDNDRKSGGSMFPNLTTLSISKCPKLHFIFPVVVARDLTKLKEMQIRFCEELKYIFGPYQHQHEERDLNQEPKNVIFDTFKEKDLYGLPNFVDIFPVKSSEPIKSEPTESKNELQDDTLSSEIKTSVEEGITSTPGKKIASPIGSESVNFEGKKDLQKNNVDEIISEPTSKKEEPTLQPKVEEPTLNPANVESSSSSSSKDEQKVQGKDHVNVENKINNSKGVPKCNLIDIDDCLKNLDDDPFALLDFMSREVSMSSKQSEISVQQSSTNEALAAELDELRTLAFSQPMLENIGKVEYRERIEAAIRKLEKFPKDVAQDLDKRIKSFVELFEKAAQVWQEQCSIVELIKKSDAENIEDLEKLQSTKDKVLQLDEAIEKNKPKLEEKEKREREVKDAMKKLKEELNELEKDKAKIESANAKCSSKKAQLIESAKYVSNCLGKTFKYLDDLEKDKAKHDADFEALKEPYKKMKDNPPF